MKNIREQVEHLLWNYDIKDRLAKEGEGAETFINDLLALIPKPRTEEDIFWDFEVLGYEIEKHNNIIYLKKNKYYIAINKEDKEYRGFYQDYKIDDDCQKYVYYQPYMIRLKEHKLLNELFECWGWIYNENIC